MSTFKDYPGGERIRSVRDLKLEGKRVFVRVDFNVPIKNSKITDDTRIRAALPTLQYLISQKAKIICASHLGRPKKSRDPSLSLLPIAERLGELIGKDVVFTEDATGHAVVQQSKNLRESEIMVLENLRYNEGEEANSQDFAYKLSELCDAFVMDAFGTCHRAHASTSALPLLIKEKGAGFLLEAEIKALSKLVHNPDRPLMSILGGAKVSDKVKVIEALMVKSSKIIIGGAMAYTFLRALKVKTGESRVEADKILLAEKLLARSEQLKCKILLPVDHLCGKSFDEPGPPITTENAHIPDGLMGLDIGPKTLELFSRELADAKTIFWNGPMGVFEKEAFAKGSIGLAQAIAQSPAPYKICGGGDSVAAVNLAKAEAGFTHISTGGGASLEMVEGLQMPGIEALKANIG